MTGLPGREDDETPFDRHARYFMHHIFFGPLIFWGIFLEILEERRILEGRKEDFVRRLEANFCPC